MSPSLKELSRTPSKMTAGHRLCAGCGEGIIVRQVLMATDKPVVISNATGCFEVSTTIYPYTAWNVPWIHTAFGNVAATAAGTEAAYKSLKRQGKIKEDVRFLALGGDGATYDIGFQALSGALERGHQFMYVCLNNEAYMNTGIQRSGATGIGASTTTSPAGSVVPGKAGYAKDLTMIVADHNVPYAAQVSPHNWRDLINKCKKGFEAKGPSFINAISPCPRGWRTDPSDTVNLAQLAVETCVWPLYEVENGKFRLTAESAKIADGKLAKRPLTDWLNAQGRFKHLMKDKWMQLVEDAQSDIDAKWERLQKLCKL
ncbi:MAG: pyruvate ferredoxin oxidoreductase [Methanomassiliicoccaceae archaeon]|jgi:pyruvate ferredoxin oxidoreductase beta subunit|nr:pyruvate ferredoxin oxidoreductase [Methanomassiliicoccaceae archaeon]